MIKTALIATALALLTIFYLLPEVVKAGQKGETACKALSLTVHAHRCYRAVASKKGIKSTYRHVKRSKWHRAKMAKAFAHGYHAGFHAGEIAAYRKAYAKGPIRTLLNGHRRIVRLVPHDYYNDNSWLYDHRP
jgi:hypothetical protein